MIRLSILLILLTGCMPSQTTKGRCVELVESGEYANKISLTLVRLVKNNKLIKASYGRSDYIYVADELCLKTDQYGNLINE